MGVLSDFIVADAQDVPTILKTVSPSGKWESAQFKGLSEVNLCQLWAILKHSSFEEADLAKFKSFSNDEQQGPWAIVVPPELTKSIAAIGDTEVPHVAELWSQTEELSMDHWRVSAVASMLQAVRKLSSSAVGGHKSLILWVSL